MSAQTLPHPIAFRPEGDRPDVLKAARDLTAELHALLSRIEPAGWSEERSREVRARLASFQGHLAALLGRAESVPATAGPLQVLGALDAAITASLPGEDEATAAAWTRFSNRIHPAYEALVRAVAPEAAAGRTLRPTNYARNLFHMLGASSVLVILAHLPDRASMIALALGVTAPAWIVEWQRGTRPAFNDWMMWLFGPVAHAHERFRVNSATWYATALSLLAVCAPMPAALLGVAVLGFGDPVAAVVGRRFGRTHLRAGRTLEGSLAFVLAGGLAGVVTLALYASSVPNRVAVAGVAAIFGAVAELFSHDLDDNLTIPLGAALGAALILALTTG